MKKILFILFFIFICFWTNRIFALDKIDINTATLTQMDELTGIGPKYAQSIIDARPFFSVDDLLKVKGIGEKTLQKIKDQGLACVNCQSTTPIPPLAIIYPNGIFINEIMPNPEGADETDEWIELYNSNNFSIDLSGWKISDTTGTITNYIFLKGTRILGNSYLLLKRPDTKIMLNNDEDGLSFSAPDNKIIDSLTYTKAPLGQSYNKINSSWQWSTSLTPGLKNIINVAQATLPKAKISAKNKIELAVADLSQALPPTSVESISPWFLFFTALTIAIISAVIVLLIKLRLKPNT